MEDDVFHETKAGTPQGGVISPLLANIALHGLEYETKKALQGDLVQYAKKKTPTISRKKSEETMPIVFYADDFVIMHESEEIVLKAKKFVEEWLKGIGLTLSQSKTRIVHSLKSKDGNKSGFDFLGFSIRQYPVTTCSRKYKTLTNEADSKPAQLARLIFRGIQRHIKVKNAQDREKNYDKMLDFSRERRVNRECKY